MTNEMKLLRAFIEASGFDVEEIKTTTLEGVPLSKPEINAPFVEVDESDIRNIIYATDYKVTKLATRGCDSNAKFTDTRDGVLTHKATKNGVKPFAFDKTGDVISIPPEAFAEAAKRDIAKGIDTRSCDSNLQQLMRVFAEIKQ